jgi:hypothetical protein
MIGPPIFLYCVCRPIVGILYLTCSQVDECKSWERDRAVSFLGIFVSNFMYSAFAVMAKLAAAKVQYTIDSIPILPQLTTTSRVVSFSYSPSEVRKDRIYGPLVVRLESLFVQWGTAT